MRLSKKPVIARPIPFVKGKCPEGTKGIGRPNGPTWQSVTPVPWPPCEREAVGRGYCGCIRPRRAAEDSGPYGQGSSHSVGADVPIRPAPAALLLRIIRPPC